MLISFEHLMTFIDKPVRGVLHVGAHLCEELQSYKKFLCDDIIWIEADPDTYLKAKEDNPDQLIYNYLITDEDNTYIPFNVANNNESSSIFDFGTHEVYHSEIKFIDKKILVSKRLDTIYKIENIKESFANFLNIDIQCAELLALKSMGKLINNFDYIYLEVNTEEVYKNCCLLDEIKEFLEKHGFEMKLIGMTKANWGDAFFVRKSQ